MRGGVGAGSSSCGTSKATCIARVSRRPPPARTCGCARRQLPDDPLLHAAVLTFASDYTLLEGVLRRHGMGWLDPRLRVASLDHPMWFHREARLDDWLLYAEDSPSAQGGRGLGIGRMYSRDGLLVASVAQEGMVRVKGA